LFRALALLSTAGFSRRDRGRTGGEAGATRTGRTPSRR
jgi:hypothetical protein